MPSQRLPVEVMSGIFRDCTFWSPPLNPFRHDELFEDMSKNTIAILLTCRLWNTIAMASPQMWTTIYTSRKWQSVSAVEVFLERSKQALLQVFIHHVQLFRRDDGTGRLQGETREARHHMLIIAHLILRHAHRIHFMSYEGFGWSMPEFSQCFPALRRIWFVVRQDSGDDDDEDEIIIRPPHLFGEDRTLALEDVCLDGPVAKYSFSNFDASRLVKLTVLQEWNMDEGFEFLTQCSALEEFELSLDREVIHPVKSRLCLPSLQVLTVHTRASHFSHYFAELPKLAHLTVYDARYNGHYAFDAEIDDDDHVYEIDEEYPLPHQTFPWPALPELVTLTLDHQYFQDIPPILRTSPTLEGLHLHGRSGLLELLRFLTGLDDASSTDENRLTASNNPLPVADLFLFRLWPRSDGSISDDSQEIVAMLRKLLIIRPELDLLIGAAYYDESDDENLWYSSLSLEDVEPLQDEFGDRCEIVDPFADVSDWLLCTRIGIDDAARDVLSLRNLYINE